MGRVQDHRLGELVLAHRQADPAAGIADPVDGLLHGQGAVGV